MSAGDLDELLHAVATGSSSAFEQLYDRSAASVGGLVRRVLVDPAQAEEVTQEVFVEIWRTAPRFDPTRGTARAWMCTLAHRRAVDRVRAAQASAERDDRVGRRDTDVPYDEVAESVEQRLDAEQLRGCLGGLSELQRESVVLAYYGGHSYPEVAARLDVPLGTVKTRMRDALIRLRSCLGAMA